MNRTEFGDGRPAKVTYHDSHQRALVEALLDSADPGVCRTSQEPIDYYSLCICGSQWKFKYCCLPRIMEAQRQAEQRRRVANDLLAAELLKVQPPAHATAASRDGGNKCPPQINKSTPPGTGSGP